MVDFTRKELVRVEGKRPGFTADAFRSLLTMPELPATPPEYRILRRQYAHSRIAVATEPGMWALCAWPKFEGSFFRIPPVSARK